jgi:hypothetical protein
MIVSHHSAMSRPVMAGLAAALALAAFAPAFAHSQAEPDADTQAETEAAPQTKGEARLAKLLEGRVAGEPVRCIRTTPSQQMQTIDKTAYVYGRGTTIYVQRTSNPGDIDSGDALVSQRFNASELCRLDQFTTADRVLGFFTGAVFFEDFIPYTRIKDEGSSEG